MYWYGSDSHIKVRTIYRCILTGNGNPIDLYQMVGRVTGRVADWNEINICNIYSPSTVQNYVLDIANATKTLAKKSKDGIETNREEYEKTLHSNTIETCAKFIPYSFKNVSFVVCSTKDEVLDAYVSRNVAELIKQPDKRCPIVTSIAPQKLLIDGKTLPFVI